MANLTGNSILTFGKYKGWRLADVAASDLSYLAWIETSTAHTINDYEQLTGRVRPHKTYVAPTPPQHAPPQQYNAGNNNVPGSNVLPSTPKYSKSVVSDFLLLSPKDFESFTQADFAHMVQVLNKAHQRKFKMSIFDTLLLVKPVLSREHAKAAEYNTTQESRDIEHPPIVDSNMDDDLPFKRVAIVN